MNSVYYYVQFVNNSPNENIGSLCKNNSKEQFIYSFCDRNIYYTFQLLFTYWFITQFINSMNETDLR